MQIVVLLAFLINRCVKCVASPPANWSSLAGAMVGYLLGVVLLGGVDLLRSRRELVRGPNIHPSVLRRHGRVNLLMQFWLLAGLAGLSYNCYQTVIIEFRNKLQAFFDVLFYIHLFGLLFRLNG